MAVGTYQTLTLAWLSRTRRPSGKRGVLPDQASAGATMAASSSRLSQGSGAADDALLETCGGAPQRLSYNLLPFA
jgi:hypothetical protein